MKIVTRVYAQVSMKQQLKTTPSRACPRLGTWHVPVHHTGCRRQRIRATPHESSEFEGVEGNEVLQDALLQQLRVQIETETLKEEIKEDLKGKVEEMKQLSEELINQLDAELGVEKFRAELEGMQVLSDANEKFNELEEQLQQIKDQIQADQADLRAFEAASASARSQGLFFKNLYEPEREEAEQVAGSSNSSSRGSSSRGRLPLDPAAARKAAAVVTSSAEEEVSSPFRMYLFGAMAAVLAVVVAQDLSTSDPSLGLDGLYTVLGLLLGVNAYNERSALEKVLSSRQDKAVEGAASNSSGSGSLGSSSSGGSGSSGGSSSSSSSSSSSDPGASSNT